MARRLALVACCALAALAALSGGAMADPAFASGLQRGFPAGLPRMDDPFTAVPYNVPKLGPTEYRGTYVSVCFGLVCVCVLCCVRACGL